ncbi:MAG: tetratricopeptide repeat protein [Deltaproteobacteria bacterium]|nr:tetratricopeptide repeat protein [Deltaproteobacteria bacterium]
MKPKLHLVFSIIVLLHCGVGTADDGVTEATAYFKEGVELFTNGEFNDAAHKFRQANQIKFNWRLLYNIAQCEAAAKHHGLALETFEEYLARGGDDVLIDRREEVMEEIRRLRDMVGYLAIDGPEGAAVFVDNTERDTLPLSGPVTVAAGVSLTVTIVADGQTVMERVVRLPGQQTVSLQVSGQSDANEASNRINEPADGMANPHASATATEPSQSATPKKPDSTEKQKTTPPATAANPNAQKIKTLQVAGWISLGAGALSLASGGVVGALALSKGKKLEDDFGSSVPYSEKRAFDDMNRLATTSTALFIGGGVLAAAGTVLLLVSVRKKEQIAAARPVVMVDPFATGIMIEGSF